MPPTKPALEVAGVERTQEAELKPPTFPSLGLRILRDSVIAEAAVEPPAVVIALNELEHSESSLLAGGECRLIDEFFFQRRKEAFDMGIVQAGSGVGETRVCLTD